MTAPPAIRLQRLIIEQLFGPGSSTVDIAFRVDGRVTVLHGRNGSGKTITLRLIAALRNGDIWEFTRYPFSKFQLTLTTSASLVIEPESTEPDSHAPRKRRQKAALRAMRFKLYAGDGSLIKEGSPLSESSQNSDQQTAFAQLGAFLPWVRKASGNTWFDSRTGMPRSIEQLIVDYEARIPPEFRRDFKLRILDPELRAFLEQLPTVKFIKADRLFVREPNRDEEEAPRELSNGLMVERLSQDIRALVVQADRKYRQVSTRLDSSLANRLFKHHKDIPELSVLKERSRVLREQTQRLRKLGLLQEDPVSLDEGALSDEQRGTFFIILKDSEEKLSPFSEVAEKAERLLSSLNRKLAPKSVRLDVEKGYQILTAAGEPLALESLSSGEQHELVLLHELLFDVRPGSLILIDEPELSLHVTWQVDVLPDLLEIAKLSDLDFVLATHSPYITNNHEELLVRLGAPV